MPVVGTVLVVAVAGAEGIMSARRVVERVHADMERDRYFTGAEAQAYGLVDRVLEQRELASRGGGFARG